MDIVTGIFVPEQLKLGRKFFICIIKPQIDGEKIKNGKIKCCVSHRRGGSSKGLTDLRQFFSFSGKILSVGAETAFSHGFGSVVHTPQISHRAP